MYTQVDTGSSKRIATFACTIFLSLDLVPKFSGMKLHFIVLFSFSNLYFSFFGIHVAVASSICREKSCTVLFFSTIDIFGPPSFSVSYQQRSTIVNLRPEHRQRVIAICLFPHNLGGYFTWLLVELVVGKKVLLLGRLEHNLMLKLFHFCLKSSNCSYDSFSHFVAKFE